MTELGEPKFKNGNKLNSNAYNACHIAALKIL